MSKPVKSVSYYLTAKKDIKTVDFGTIRRGRSFSITPKLWAKVKKSNHVPFNTIDYSWDADLIPLHLFRVEKITHIEQYIIEKIKTIA